jgi:hypothetical protein
MLKEKGMTGTGKDLKLSLCKACMSMTYTILDNGLKKCGKCKYAKEQ